MKSLLLSPLLAVGLLIGQIGDATAQQAQMGQQIQASSGLTIPVVPVAPQPSVTAPASPGDKHVSKSPALTQVAGQSATVPIVPVNQISTSPAPQGALPAAATTNTAIPQTALTQANSATSSGDAPLMTAIPVAPVRSAPIGSAQPLPNTAGTSIATVPATSAAPANLPAPPPRKIELPVPAMPSAHPVANDALALPLNKTLGITVDKAVRDVIVGNPDIADIIVRSQNQIYLIGKKTGDTNVFLVDAEGNMIRKVDVVVQPDVDGIQSNISTLLPGENIQVKGMGDSVVLSGTASSDGVAARARNIARRFVAQDDNVISMLKVSSEQQVLLKVRVAEANKSVLKQLGVDNLLSPTTLGPLTIDAATSALGIGPIGSMAGSLGLSAGNWSSNIQLLEQQGYIRTLAEPNLLAVSGETASMLAGGEYPIPIAQQNGTISVDYKPFGVILSFLPVVLDSGQINLRIATEVSALSDQNNVAVAGFTFKSFITRRANSVVEMPSGGSIMIAGLLQNNITGSLTGVPGLMDLPILGALFRSSSYQRNETELVIIVSAVLAKPVDQRKLALPTDGFAPSTDLDRYFLGHLQNIYVKKPTQGPNAPQSLMGPIGYIVQ